MRKLNVTDNRKNTVLAVLAGAGFLTAAVSAVRKRRSHKRQREMMRDMENEIELLRIDVEDGDEENKKLFEILKRMAEEYEERFQNTESEVACCHDHLEALLREMDEKREPEIKWRR